MPVHLYRLSTYQTNEKNQVILKNNEMEKRLSVHKLFTLSFKNSDCLSVT
jgi:hypothetical protein